MSQENVEVARRNYDAFNRRDLEGIAADLAPDFEYVTTGFIPGVRGAFRGAEGWREFAGWMWSEFDEPRIDVHNLIEAGDEVLVAEVTLRGRGKQSGVETGWHVWHVWTWLDGKIVRGQAFSTRQAALEAAGLSERAMSEENVEILRRGYERFNRTGELDPERWDADAVMDNSNAIFADPGTYRGFDRIQEFFAAQGEMWASQRYEPQEFIPVGADQVVVAQQIISVGRDGVEVVARTALLYTLRAGKVTHLKNFQSKGEALEAAGLPD
jgi:uncharacterized protein